MRVINICIIKWTVIWDYLEIWKKFGIVSNMWMQFIALKGCILIFPRRRIVLIVSLNCLSTISVECWKWSTISLIPTLCPTINRNIPTAYPCDPCEFIKNLCSQIVTETCKCWPIYAKLLITCTRIVIQYLFNKYITSQHGDTLRLLRNIVVLFSTNISKKNISLSSSSSEEDELLL